MDAPDEALPDGETAGVACKLLGQLRDRPFFLAVGFRKPHLPFTAPQRYFDLYPPDSITTASNPFAPKDVPAVALHNWDELRGCQGVPIKGPVSETMARELVRAYYACVSYMDAQVGRLLRQLEQLQLHERTLVVFWGDNGYELGEHGLWCKHSNFEDAARVPLIVRAPGHMTPGARTDALVECVDVYPSLCELAGLPAPTALEGTSFVPLLKTPAKPWKKAAFSQYPRTAEGVGPVMGHSMRTDRYRYTEWRGSQKEFLARELYDHQNDPAENTNVAGIAANATLVARLSDELKAGWKAALPPA
jgi:arylsulfatase A-like enzyme